MNAQLVLGNPGTGKTYNLVQLINGFIEQGYRASDITVLSHTRGAAREIARRASSTGVNASTIHSMAYNLADIVKEQVISPSELKEFSNKIGTPMKMGFAASDATLEEGDEYIAVINYAESRCMPYTWAYNDKGRPGTLSGFEYFYENYLHWKSEYGLIDFSDMINKAIDSDKIPNIPVLLIDECFIEGTEVLTDKGFKDFRCIDYKHKIAQHKKGIITFVKPTRIIKKSYDGEVFEFNGKQFDQCGVTVTKNHNMLPHDGGYFSTGIPNFSLTPAVKCKNVMFSTAGIGVGTDVFTDEQRLHIAIQADGHIMKSGLVRFMISKKRKQKRIEWLLKKCNIEWYHTKERTEFKQNPNANSAKVYCFHPPFKATKNLWDWFNLSNLSCVVAREVIEEAILWDGYEQNLGYYIYYSNNIDQVNLLQVVAILAGYKTTVSVKQHSSIEQNDTFCLYISTNKRNTKQKSKKGIYKGNVYCVTVPEGEIIVRYKLNSPIIVGNCQDLSKQQWKLIDKIESEEMVVTGDPDQALFLWGGAEPKLMFEWAKRSGAEIIELSQSYRVPKAAHELSLSIIRKVKNRYEKSYLPTDVEGSVDRFLSVTHYDFSEVESALILYRNHAIRKEVERELIFRNKAYKTLNGITSPCHNKYGRGVEAWINIKKSGLPDSKDIDRVKIIATPHLLRAIRNNNLDAIMAMKGAVALDIPYEMFKYYQYVDFSKKNDIQLSTIHGAKGMEHDLVILINGVTQRVLEGAIKNPDQELMVWYVAATRTKDKLHIIDGDDAIL